MFSKQKRKLTEQKIYEVQQGKIKKPDVYGIQKHKVLQQQFLDSNEDDEFGDDIQVESDAVTTANYLINSNPKSNLPTCLVHQIYNILPNSTVIDRELQQIIKEGVWRKFHVIGALEDEYLLMKTLDYLKIIQNLKEVYEQSGENVDLKAFDVFCNIVSDKRYREVSISKDALISELQLTEKNISLLVSCGLLLPHIQINIYWFSIPKQGHFMSNLTNGRVSILRILKRRNTKDIMEKLLRQKKLQKTNFGFDFLLHDLLGSGRVERYKTAMGDLIRLTSKGEKGI